MIWSLKTRALTAQVMVDDVDGDEEGIVDVVLDDNAIRQVNQAKIIVVEKKLTSVAPLAWVPWVPGNPSIFEQWVPEPINFGKKGLNYTLFSV